MTLKCRELILYLIGFFIVFIQFMKSNQLYLDSFLSISIILILSFFYFKKYIIKHDKDFIKELEVLLRENNISISHEDTQGSFIFENFDEDNLKWLIDGWEYNNRTNMKN